MQVNHKLPDVCVDYLLLGNVLKNNMRCESWFRTLKYGYMRGIRNKKLGE